MRNILMAAAVARSIGIVRPYDLLGNEWDFTIAQPSFKDGVFSDPRQSSSVITGTVLQSTGKFGEPCMHFQGGSRINYTLSPISLQGDFTIEGYFNWDSITVSTNQYLLDIGANGLNLRFYGGTVGVYNAGTLIVNSDLVPVVGQWYHIAIVRQDGVVQLFIDGVKRSQAAYTTRLSPTTTSIGNYGGSTGFAFRGKVSQLRVVLKAIYSDNFTPPQAPWVIIQEQPDYDPHFSNVNLLIKADGGAVDLISGNALANQGGTVDTTIKKFGDGSLKTGNDGAFLYTHNKSDYDFGSMDFTLEAWVYPTQVKTTEQFIIGRRRTNNAGGFKLSLVNMRLQLSLSTSTPTWAINLAAPAGTELALDKWYHVAAVRSGTHLRLYIDGILVQTGTSSATLNASTLDLAIGSDSSGTAYPFNGNIDSVRVTRGIARYQRKQFTPKNMDFVQTNTPGFVNGDPLSDMVSLAVEGHGHTESGTEQYPSTATLVNQPIIDSTRQLFNKPTLQFTTQSGSSKALKLEPGRPLISSPDFTIEAWVNTDYRGSSPTFPIVSQWVSGGGTGQWMFSSRSGKLGFWYSPTGVIESDVVFTDENWHHVAVVRKDGVISIYFDGVVVVSSSISTSFQAAVDNQVGYNTNLLSAGHRMNITRLRITNGFGRYSDSFIPNEETINYGRVSI